MIPLRNMAEPSANGRVKARGFGRGLMRTGFDRAVYNSISQVETVNSMVKRKTGDVVYGRTEAARHREVLFKCIAHNIRRLMDLKHSLQGWFHQSSADNRFIFKK